MAEPNPTQNMFGSGGSDGIAGKATNSLRNMTSGAQQLVSQLRIARDLMAQMERSSANIARNMQGAGGGRRGGGPGTPGINTGGVGSSGNNLLRQTSFSVIGTAVGSAMGGALGGVQNNLLGFSDRATQVRQWNPGRFGTQRSALNSTLPWLAAGQNASDALSASMLYSQGFGGPNFSPFANAGALGARLTGMSYGDSLNAATGLQSMNMVWMLRANGIQPRTPGSMSMMTPQQMAAQLYARGSSRMVGMNAQQRADAINFSLRPGGYLKSFMNNAGLSSDSQNLLTSLMLAQSNSGGKDISKMSQSDIEKLLSSGDYGNYRGSQAKRAAAAARAQIGMVDAADTSYSAVANAQTAILKSMDNTLGRILEALTGGAMGAGSAMGINATGLLGGIAGNLIANRIAGRGAGGAGGPGGPLRGAGSLLRGVGGGSLLRGAARVGGGAVLGAVADYGGGWLRNKLEGLNGGVDPNDNSSGANLRRFGTLALGVGQSAAVGASMGMMLGPWGAGAGAVAGTVWGLGRGIMDWAGQGGNYGTVQQDNPNSLSDGQAEVGSRGTPATGGNSRTSAATGGSAASSTSLIDEAMRWLGTPYSWGGGGLSGPGYGQGRGARTKGFDCSSFVQYVYHKFGVNLPRTSQAQASAGKEIPRDAAQKGDLLIFSFAGETNGHVAIYLGNNKMIHAPHTGDVVRLSGVPWGSVTHIRRVIGAAMVGGQTSVGTSGTGSSIGTSSGGPYWNGHGPIYYGDPVSSATQNATSAGGSPASSSSGGGGKPAPAGQVKDWIDQALKIIGKDPKQFEGGLYNMIMHESSGNPRAQNNTDSNAKAGHPSKGILQTIDSTFNKWSIAGHKNIWNAVDNIIAGFRYAESTYGDAMIAGGGRHDSHGNYQGYSEGAWRINRDQTARIHEGEMILPKAMAESMRTAIRDGFAGQGRSGGSPVQVTMHVNVYGATEKSATEMVRKFEQTLTRAKSLSTVRTR